MLRSSEKAEAEVSVDAQMNPEKNIAFTVIPAMVLAWRSTNRGRAWPAQSAWQKKLEEDVLSTIEETKRLEPSEAASVVTAIVPANFRRLRGNVRSGWYFLNEWRRM